MAVGSDALAMECRGSDAPLPHVEGAFAGDETFAEQNFHAPLGALLDNLLGVVDQHFADEVGVIDEDDVLPAQFIVRDAAVSGSEVFEEKDGVRRLEETAGRKEEEVER